MGKIAFLFPGQGSQKVGMCSDVKERRSEIYDRYLEAADDASGLPVKRLVEEGPIEELTNTAVAQPALFATSLAVLDVARESGLSADFVAGHSLGEYTAAVASGAIDADTGMQLVSKRGRLMADIQSTRPGTMAAIIGLPAARVRELCEQASVKGSVAPANLNTPAQVVCSGEEDAVAELIRLAEDEADKVVRLQVGAAFHSKLMEPVMEEMATAMAGVEWRDPDTPLVGNATAEVKTSADDVREALTKQIANPVLWVECTRTMVDNGVDTFLELGSGRVLSGLVRQINSDVETFSADGAKKIAKFAERQEA